MDASFLIQDLLAFEAVDSHSRLPPSIAGQLSQTLAKLSLQNPKGISSITYYLAVSPSLSAPFNKEVVATLYQAVRAGCYSRSKTITQQFGSGWRARREYAKFCSAFYDGIPSNSRNSLARLVLCSALLSSLQTIKARKEELHVGGSSLLCRAEEVVVTAWKDYINHSSGGLDQEEDIAVHLAQHTFPLISVSALSTGPVSKILSRLSQKLFSVLQHGRFFVDPPLNKDLTQNGDLLEWTIPSPSNDNIKSIVNDPIFLTLGPLARGMGKCIEATRLPKPNNKTKFTQKDGEAVFQLYEDLEKVTRTIRDTWKDTLWSDCSDLDLTEPTQKVTEVWNILKHLLFAVVILHSSLLVTVTPESASLPPTPSQAKLSLLACQVLSNTYFITSTVGPNGFPAWRGVFQGFNQLIIASSLAHMKSVPQEEKRFDLLDTVFGALGLKESSITKLTSQPHSVRLLKVLEPPELGSLHQGNVDISIATYFMNTAEMLMLTVPDYDVESQILVCCKPYLDATDHKYQSAYEAAHSVVLTVFSTKKNCSVSLSKWYTELLLKPYTGSYSNDNGLKMSSIQLKIAFTAMVTAVSEKDDSVAWWSILELLHRIDHLNTPSLARQSPKVTLQEEDARGQIYSHTPVFHDVPPTSISAVSKPTLPILVEEDGTFGVEPNTGSTPPESWEGHTPVEKAILNSPALSSSKGALILVLIDQLTSVSLPLLDTLMDEIWRVVKESVGGAQETKMNEEIVKIKLAFSEVIFATINNGLDEVKKEEGVRWWLERREELVFGTSKDITEIKNQLGSNTTGGQEKK